MTQMTVAVTAAADNTDLDGFYQWLRDDTDVVRNAEVTCLNDPDGSGHMGALEIVNVVLSNSTALASLALAYASWRRAKGADSGPMKFSRAGTSVVVVTGSHADVQRIVEDLGAGEDPGDADA